MPLTGDPADATSNSPAGYVRAIVKQILAPELAAGLRLDVNRPLGNGRDDNGNGVVDESGEDLISSPTKIWSQPNPATAASYEVMDQAFVNANFTPLDVPYKTDPEPGVINDNDSAVQRQLLARHLYVLALTTTAHPGYAINGGPADPATAKRLAQWAINAVDFRDADNIMTPFEYDLNPFDGWDPDSDVGTAPDHAGPDGNPNTADDTLVWGCERPELLINETMAFQDRNTTDEADEDPNQGEEPGDSSDPLNEPAGEFDQLYRPRGAFFLELYNPWPAAPATNADTHLIVNGNDIGVDLGALDKQTDTTPVWRLMVYRDPDVTKDPDDRARMPSNPDRSVYFAGFDPQFGNDSHKAIANWPASGSPDSDGTAFYNDFADANTRSVPPVRPNRYLVVGSGNETAPNSGVYESQLGQRLDQLPSARLRKPLRRIEMNVNSGVDTVPIRMVDNDAGDNSTAMQQPARQGAGQDSPTVAYPMEPPSEQSVAQYNFPQMAAGSNPMTSIADVAVINAPRRLTLSEPAAGYPNSVGNVAWVWRKDMPKEVQDTFDPSEDGAYCAGMGRDPATRVPIGDPNRPKAIDTPLDDGEQALQDIGTVYGYRQVFLQRLANPLMPFDPVTNPYRTIDRTSVNLSVFSGRLSRTQSEHGKRNSECRPGFSSLERGYRGVGQGDRNYELWAIQPLERSQEVDRDVKRAADTPRRDRVLAQRHPALHVRLPQPLVHGQPRRRPRACGSGPTIRSPGSRGTTGPTSAATSCCWCLASGRRCCSTTSRCRTMTTGKRMTRRRLI